jgi:hypothetical protein
MRKRKSRRRKKKEKEEEEEGGGGETVGENSGKRGGKERVWPARGFKEY